MSRWRAYRPELALATAAVLYGSTFTIVQDALHDITAVGFDTLRFALGAAVLIPFGLVRGWSGPEPRPGDTARTLWLGGASLGVLATIAYTCQNVGLQHTSTSNSAFITGLFAVTTPVIELIVFRRRPRRGIVVAVGLSVIGLFLLTGARPTLGFGDAISLVTAVAFGAWFVQIGILVRRVDVIALTAVQLGTIATLSAGLAVVSGFGAVTTRVVLAIVFTGIGCSAIAFSLTSWAQRTIEPARASLLSLLEPVVAGILGYVVGERLGVVGDVGAALVLIAILVAERGTHAAGRARPSLDRAVKSTGE